MLNLESYVWDVCQIFLNNDQAETQRDTFDMLRCNIEKGEELYSFAFPPYQFLNEVWGQWTMRCGNKA